MSKDKTPEPTQEEIQYVLSALNLCPTTENQAELSLARRLALLRRADKARFMKELRQMLTH